MALRELEAGVAPACARCGARLETAIPPPSVRCPYCGTTFELVAPNVPGVPPASADQAPRSGFRPKLAVMIVLPVLLAVGVAVAVGARTARLAADHASSKPPATIYTPASPLADRITVDTWTEPPHIVAIDGDGVEDVVVRYSSFAGGKACLFVGGFDGATLERRWSIGPLADLGTESAATRVAVLGTRVVIADARAMLHVHALTTGAEQTLLPLPDRAEKIHVAPRGDAAWLKIVGGKDVLFDPAAGAITPSPPPAWMPPKLKVLEAQDCEMAFRSAGVHARCAPKRAVPSIRGFVAQNALLEGDDAVALGTRSPGTRAPMIAGFDPRTNTVRWSGLLSRDALSVQEGAPRVADLAGGRVAVVYATSSGEGRTATFDARTGARLWEVATPRAASAFLVVTPARVYVPAVSVVRVYDASKGALLGTIGTP